MVLDRSQSRSAKYQSTLLEISYDPVLLFDYSDSKMYGDIENENKIDELKELREELTKAMWELIDRSLTERQRQILHLIYQQNLTQNETAHILSINQSSVVKSIRGNCDYSKPKTSKKLNSKDKKTFYGGTFRKIKKLIEQDEKIQAILLKIGELQNE